MPVLLCGQGFVLRGKGGCFDGEKDSPIVCMLQLGRGTQKLLYSKPPDL